MTNYSSASRQLHKNSNDHAAAMHDRTKNAVFEARPGPLPPRLFPPGVFVVAAHRGDNAHFPENTMAAFSGALAAKASMMELDVTLSADGRLVVIHDSTLDRTTNGSGRVSAFSMDELAGLDAGSWFAPGFSGERLPALEDVFSAFGGKIVINVEIKKEAARVCGDFPKVFVQVANLARERGLAGKVLVSCFDDEVLADFAAVAPEIAIGVLSDKPEGPDEALKRVKRLRAASYHQNALLLTRDLVDAMHENGTMIIAWTGKQDNTKENLRKMLDMGADGFFADDPAAALTEIARWKEKNEFACFG